MKKILQSFWKNRSVSKGSFIILIITVILSSTAVFGAMNALPLLKIVIRNDMQSGSSGRSDFVIAGLENSVFSLDDIKTAHEVTGILHYYGILEDDNKKKCDIIGGDYNKMPDVFDIELTDGKELKSLTGGAVITKRLADSKDLRQGDALEILINERPYTFEIVGIAFNKGLLSDTDYLLMLPKEDLDSILFTETDDVTRAYIYGCNKDTTVSDIGISNGLTVTKVVDENFIDSEINMYGLMLSFILLFVFFIAFYIIYNLYNIFVIERSRYIGTLRSCGASRKYIYKVFVIANMVISMAAGLIGVLIGQAAVSLFAWKVLAINYMKAEYAYILLSFAVTILFSLMLGAVSIVLPLHKVLGYSERALLNNEMERSNRKNKLLPCGAFAVTVFLWIFTSVRSTNNLLLECAVFIIFIIASIIGIGVFLLLFDIVIGKRIGKGAALIAVKNVINNAYLLKNITIIAILSILMMMVGNLSYSVLKGMSSFYNNYKCNVYFEASSAFDNEDLKKIDAIEGVTRYYACTSKRMVINGKDEVSCFIEDEPERLSDEFLEFNIRWEGFREEEFGQGRYCIITEVLSKRYQLNAGDSIRISRRNIEEEYQIAAISRTTIEKGNFMFISSYELPFEDCADSNLILADCGNISGFLSELEVTFADRTIYLTSVEEKVIEDEENSAGLIALFSVFSVFVVFVGMQGIYHNFKLSYMNRKKVFAVMMSSGYRLRVLFLILLIETMICSLTGGIISYFYMQVYRQEIVNIMFLMDLALPLRDNLWITLLPMILCMTASLLSILITSGELKKMRTNLIRILNI